MIQDSGINHNFAVASKKLAANVILQAIDDLTAPEPKNADARDYGMIREHAELFFFSPGNEWRRNREFWGALAGGYSADELSRVAREKLREAGRTPKVKHPRPCAVLPTVDKLLDMLDDGVLRLEDVRAKFGLDQTRAMSCLGKLRDAGFTVRVTARLSGAYRVTPR